MDVNNFLTICFSRLGKECLGPIPDDQLSTNRGITLVDSFLVSGMIIVRFLYRSVKIITSLFPYSVFC